MNIIKSHKIAGINLVSKNSEEGNSQVIIFLHGWLDNAASFDSLIPLVERCNKIAIDLPGHGFSGHRSEDCFEYTIMDYAIFIIKYIKEVINTPFILVGHSMGASISSIIASLLPDLVTKLILIDGLMPFTSPVNETYERCKKYLNEVIIDEKKSKNYKNYEEAAQARFAVGNIDYESALLIVKRSMIQESNGSFRWTYDNRLTRTTPNRFKFEELIYFIKNIKAKILYLESDHIKANNESEKIKMYLEHFGNINVQHIQGNHYIHINKAIVVADFINKFLRNQL